MGGVTIFCVATGLDVNAIAKVPKRIQRALMEEVRKAQLSWPSPATRHILASSEFERSHAVRAVL
jgi:hypothetical protein